jgi:hypothetical protein
MKPKLRYQLPPSAIIAPRNDRARQEIRNFLQAVDTYPARASKEPRVSFLQHLCSFFGAADDGSYDRSRRH